MAQRLVTRDFGTCLNFTGTSGVTTPHTPNLTEFSVSFWVKRQSITANARFVDWQDAGPTNGFTFSANGALIGNIGFTAANIAVQSGVLPINKWHHLVGTFKHNGTDSTVKMYVGGLLVGTTTTGGLMSATAGTLKIGNRVTGTANPANARMDEVLFYDRELTSTEIANLYFNGSIPTGLAAGYLFDERRGTVANDFSGNGKTGTISGATYSTQTPLKLRNPNKYVIPDVTYTMAISANNGELLRRKPGSSTVLQKSIDDGANWTDLYTFPDTVHYYIKVANGNYLVSVGGNITDATPGDIYLSTDNGVSFAKTLDLVSGDAVYWNMTHSGATVFVSEYGAYPSRRVFRSQDSGVTWSTVFTHPEAVLDVHIHSVCIDDEDPNNVVIAVGDDITPEGVWFSQDGGDNFTEVIDSADNKQVIQVLFGGGYVLLASDDGTGNIYRDTIANFKANTVSLETVWNASNDGLTSQVYGASKDKLGQMWFASTDEANAGFGRPYLIMTPDYGETWQIIKEYPKTGASKGVYFLSNGMMDNNYIYIASSNGEGGKIAYRGAPISRSTASNRLSARDMGTALNFTGGDTDNVTTTVNALTSLPAGHTISLWARPRNNGASAASLYEADASGADRFYLQQRTNAPTSLTIGLSSWNAEVANAVKLNEWQHYTVVLDGTTGRIYRNGVQIATQATITVSIPNAPIIIGNVTAKNISFFGQIDEPRIWNRALTTDEIHNLYVYGVVPQDGLVAEYLFNEGSGSTALDTSGNGNNGTITGTTYTTDVPLRLRTAV